MGEGDAASSVEDAFLPEVGLPESYDTFREEKNAVSARISETLRQYPDFRTSEAVLAAAVNAMDPEAREQFETAREARASKSGFPHVGLHHATIGDLLPGGCLGQFEMLTLEQAASFTAYAVIRNPLSRALSGFLFSRGGGLPRGFPLMKEDFHQDVLNDRLVGLVYRDQADYFEGYNVQPVRFEHYESDLSSLITKLGGTPLAEYPKFKSNTTRSFAPEDKPSVATWIEPYPRVKAALLERYSNDQAIWEAAP
jgi:hypothetical protein